MPATRRGSCPSLPHEKDSGVFPAGACPSGTPLPRLEGGRRGLVQLGGNGLKAETRACSLLSPGSEQSEEVFLAEL